MLDTKWPITQADSMTNNYISLPYPTFNNNNDNKSLSQNNSSSTSSSQQGLMSILQPETPRPSASKEKSSAAPNFGRKSSSASTSKTVNYTTTTFHSNPYPSAGPIRRRRAESIFSFDVGPTFSTTKQLYDIMSRDQSNNYQLQLHAKMDRGFFRAEQDWTCYRRNYFQVSATFDVHGINYLVQGPEVPCLLKKPETQELLQVEFFSIGIRATISSNDKKIELVQHTPKRDKGPQLTPEPRPVRAGGNLHLATMGSNNSIVTFERLQFKTATANNGKRRAAQQYYEIIVDLYANFSHNYKPLRVATCTSAPLVVRGRSPGHYADSHTRFKHKDKDSTSVSQNATKTSAASMTSTNNTPTSSTTTAATNDDRFSSKLNSNNLEHSSSASNQRYPSLPNSPISEFGHYSPYNGYSYSSLPGFPSIIPPPQTLHPYPNHISSNSGPLSTPYYQNVTQKAFHLPQS